MWKPGVSANPKGRPKTGNSLAELMREFLQQAPPDQKKTYQQLFIDKTYHKAVVEGDVAAIKLIWSYIDGMPKQSVDHTTNGQQLPQPIINVPTNNSNSEDNKPQ